MILEGFEIEDWSCIGRVAVSDLPPSGVIVLHGPNGTGKSSILEALRAGLMDRKSTSKSLGRGYKNGSDKPRVSVTFRAEGRSWRITKQFNSKESKLESRSPSGQWKVETTDASEAHERTRRLTGGVDSTLGLHQLLWLTQAEFRLPGPKDFDADVQSRLRGVLGVLQTPLDDRFLARVKEGWTRWYSARNRPGEKPKLKKDSPLDKLLAELQRRKDDLAATEAEYRAFEALMEQSSRLEKDLRDYSRRRDERSRDRQRFAEEYERCRDRLNAHRIAADRVEAAEKALTSIKDLRCRREDFDRRVREAEDAAASASRAVEEASRRLQHGERRAAEIDAEIKALRIRARDAQSRLNDVTERRQRLMLASQADAARARLVDAQRIASELESLNLQAAERPAPDDATLHDLGENRAKAARLRADLDAAAIVLRLIPAPGSPAPSLSIDEAGASPSESPADGSPIERTVRRSATIEIPGWGGVEIARGSDARSLDQIESDLAALDREFADVLIDFPAARSDPMPLDRLRTLTAERKAREPERKRMQEELNRLAPGGLDALTQEVSRIEARLAAEPTLPVEDPTELERLASGSKDEVARLESSLAVLSESAEAIRGEVEGDVRSPGSRRRESESRERLATLAATAKVLREDRERMPAIDQLDADLRSAESALAVARADLASARLSDDEGTIADRLAAADEGLRALNRQIDESRREFHRVEGALRLSEGLHQKRAAASARVEELTRLAEREALEADAYDRLFALFEECREKQLGAVMGPIHDRVVRWMNLLRIGDYRAIRFNDQFLPEALIGGDGATELTLGDESTGTVEQIALMVRLALGSTLSTPDEPVVAMLDDPLTHSDRYRLDNMRAVLKSAAAGDPHASPPAGPLQVIVFTSHPEWFLIDGARTIDLSRPDVLVRRC